MIDLLALAVLAVVTWAVASEGAWGAAMLCLSVLFSGLLAMNFFEPVASFLERGVAASWSARWDVIALVGLFTLFVFLFRLATEHLSPTFMSVHPLVYDVGRWGCGLLTGYITVAFLLTALHTAPLPREFLGFTPEPQRRNGPVGALAPDFQWLGFTQYVSEHSLGRGRIFDGPQFDVGDHTGQIWPSFPIRYATRRATLGSGSSGGLKPAGEQQSGGLKKPGSPGSGATGSPRKSKPNF